MVTFVILALILAQGNGFVVTPSDIRPYWQTYSKSHGFPSEIQEKREILNNYLADFLMFKRAKELKLDKSEEFLREWHDAKENILLRCRKEEINKVKCNRILESVKRFLLIGLIVEKKVVPKIKVKEEEISEMLNAHHGRKNERKLTRGSIFRFLRERKQSEALHAYVRSLMEKYKVKIDDNALKKLVISNAY